MSKYSLSAKVDFILEMCTNIQKIVKRHKGIVKALEDYEGQQLEEKFLLIKDELSDDKNI